MSSFAPPSFDNDNINSGDSPDRLGFQPIADKLCISILDQATAGGIVIGIEGKWGCGKSSLMRRVENELRKRSDAPEIVNFAPWLIRSRDALIEGLIAELSGAAKKIEAEAQEAATKQGKSGRRKSAKDTVREAGSAAGEALVKYGSSVGKLGKLAKIAGNVLPGVGAAGTVLEIGAEMLASIGQPKELHEQKQAAALALAALSRRIVVFIDDLDRLEPTEIAEVLRLVRAVADFPNVIYVLSYDRKAVTSALEAVLKIKDGTEYLEKFVQVDFKVPKPEDFDLRRWFRAEATDIFAQQLADGRDSDRRDISRRVDQYIDSSGGRYLHTPRDVVRALNALKLYGPPVANLVDIPDLIWLQLVRTNDPALYDWIESYMIGVAAVASGASISEIGRRKALKRLKRTLKKQDLVLGDQISFELQEMLPGIQWDFDKEKHPDGWKVFHDLSDATVKKWKARRRLGSPHHFRYYFALTPPQGIPADDEVMKLIALAAVSRVDASDFIASTARTVRPVGGVALDPMLSRLLSLSEKELPVAGIPNLLYGLADVVDEASILSCNRHWGIDWLSVTAERAFRDLLRRVPKEIQLNVVDEIFSNGEALGWIAGLLADDIFARGLAGEDKGSQEAFFEAKEFEAARSILLDRIKAAPAEKIMAVPRLPSLLYTWKRLGDPQDVHKWCAQQTQSDEKLLTFLVKMRGWANASNIGIYYPLNKSTISEFIDYDNAVARVQKLATTANDKKARELAEELSLAFRQGEK